MGKYLVKTVKSGGCKFSLKADNGQEIATSQVYAGKSTCKKGINSVRVNAPAAKIEDQTKEGYETLKCPKFEVYTDKAGETRFRLRARNGQVIASSEGYSKHAGALAGIDSVVRNADSEIEYQKEEN